MKHPLLRCPTALFAKALTVFLLGLLHAAPGNAQPAAFETDLPEEVIVLGARPGPPLWRIENGNKTLWIFGMLQPLPKTLQWESSSVEWIIAQSQQYIMPPSISASTSNPLTAISTLRKIKKLERLQKGTSLKDVLPTDLYARFKDQRLVFAPRSRKIARLQPMAAADRLYEAALKTVGLETNSSIEKKLKKMARKHDVEIVSTAGEVPISQVLTILRGISLEAQISCLETTLSSISSDLHSSIERANAWAAGDESMLRAMDYPDQHAQCTKAMLNGPAAAAERAKSRLKWLDTATNALQNNEVTFATLPIAELIAHDGLLSELAQRGFQIRGKPYEPD